MSNVQSGREMVSSPSELPKGEGTPLRVPKVRLIKIRKTDSITEFEYRIMLDDNWIGLIRKYKFDDKPNISVFIEDISQITVHGATEKNIVEKTDEPWIKIKS